MSPWLPLQADTIPAALRTLPYSGVPSPVARTSRRRCPTGSLSLRGAPREEPQHGRAPGRCCPDALWLCLAAERLELVVLPDGAVVVRRLPHGLFHHGFFHRAGIVISVPRRARLASSPNVAGTLSIWPKCM